jgi:hypothetical protein
MFERFTDRARRVVVLAQEEARMLNHNYIGTEHILLGLIHEGEGVAAKALESLGISLDAVRQQVEEIIGQGQQAPSGHIPFTPRAKKVLELSLREALQLGHNYIGTEHILLGLIREGDGVAAQVLVKLGAELNRVRLQVIELISGQQPQPGRRPPREGAPGRTPLTWMSRSTGSAASGTPPPMPRSMSRPRRCVTGRRNCWPARPRGRSNGPPGTRPCRFWPSNASSSAARSSGSAPCSVSTASTRTISQPDLNPVAPRSLNPGLARSLAAYASTSQPSPGQDSRRNHHAGRRRGIGYAGLRIGQFS